MKRKLFLFSGVFLLFLFSASAAYAEDIQKASLILPKELIFAGKPIPNDPFIRERIEREFYEFLDIKYVYAAKLTGRYFSFIEDELAKAGLHNDFKYVAIAESGLIQEAVSSKQAVGIWQFMKKTAQRFGLRVDNVIDERRDPDKATTAAAKYLKWLIDYFKGDVFLALAAYNDGEGDIIKALKAQGAKDFWSLKRSNETSRYVSRVIAAKVVFSEIKKHFEISADDLYHPLLFKEIELILRKSEALAKIAEEQNVPLYVFNHLNPFFTSNFLPQGKYKIRIPVQPAAVD